MEKYIIDSGKKEFKDIPQKDDGTIRVMSCNLKCADDPEGSVKKRSEITLAIIINMSPILSLFRRQQEDGENFLTKVSARNIAV